MDLRVGTRVNVCDIFYFKGIKAAGEGGERVRGRGEREGVAGRKGKSWKGEGGRGRKGGRRDEWMT